MKTLISDMEKEQFYSLSDQMEVVFSMDKARLYHFKGAEEGAKPVLLIYALINKPYIMDFDKEMSFVRGLMENGLDVYLINWGDPTRDEKFLTLDNYIEWYLRGAVDTIKERHGVDKISLVMLCQGGVMGSIYAALHPEDIEYIVPIATPVDFTGMARSIFSLAVELKGDAFIEAFGMVPPSMLNSGLLFAKPFEAFIDRYTELFDKRKERSFVFEFMKKERWTFDSPAQASKALLQWLNDIWKDNKLYKGTLKIGGRTVNLKNIKVPALIIYGTKDDFAPIEATKPMEELLGSDVIDVKEYPEDHLGLVAGRKAKNEIARDVAEWILSHPERKA